MKKILFMVLSIVLIAMPNDARADLFGGDVVVLTQILTETIQELVQMQQMVKGAQDQLGLLQDINRGINDSLHMADTLGLRTDPGLYGQLKQIDQLLGHLRGSYGTAVDSPDRGAQEDTDQVVAEAITMNNSLYDYTNELDKVGDQIKDYSHSVSPGGAQKLTAQSLGVLVHVMNQQLRATATGLKLQAQQLAVQNKKEKQQTAAYLDQGNLLKTAMKSKQTNFEFPRF